MDSRCVFVSACRHSGGECLPTRPRTCNMCCNGAAVKLRLMEQACGCSAVCARRRRTHGACLSLPAGTVTQNTSSSPPRPTHPTPRVMAKLTPRVCKWLHLVAARWRSPCGSVRGRSAVRPSVHGMPTLCSGVCSHPRSWHRVRLQEVGGKPPDVGQRDHLLHSRT